MKYSIVIDTNVLVSALHSRDGSSFVLISLLGENDKFDIYISVALVLEYEDAAKRLLGKIQITEAVIDDVIDYTCQVGIEQQVFFLWRPFLKDPNDDMVLELAVAEGCNFIITQLHTTNRISKISKSLDYRQFRQWNFFAGLE